MPQIKLQVTQISDIRWYKVLRRKQSLLFTNYLIAGCGKKSIKKILGLNCGSDSYMMLDDCIYLSSDDKLKNEAFHEKNLSKFGASEYARFIKKWIEWGEALLKTASKIHNTQVQKLSNAQLLKLFREYSKKNFLLSSAVISVLDIGGVLETEVKKILVEKMSESDELLESYFGTLVFPRLSNDPGLEQKEFYSLALLLKKKGMRNVNKEKIGNILKNDPKLKTRIEKYLNDFSWIGTRGFLGNGWNMDDFLERLSHSLQEDIEKKKKDIETIAKKSTAQSEVIMKKLKFNKKEKDIVWVAKDYVFMRTYRTDVFNKGGYLVRNLLMEIGERFGYALDDMFYLSFEEIVGLFGGKRVSKKMIASRQEGYLEILYKDRVYVGNETQMKYLKKRVEENTTQELREVKGNSVSVRGILRGVVKIVFSRKDFDKFKKGEILVASMTTPEYIPIMEKAAAFITDEGGILCHAAIVSREMKKPCIIGTKIATKVLKDGDLVEVDANAGVVKILKNE